MSDLRQMLSAFAEQCHALSTPPYAKRDLATVELFLKLLQSPQDPFVRANTFGHFTGSALVVSPDGTDVCLIYHKKLQKWLQPGGHADGNRNLDEVALKEVEEETGLRGLIVSEPGSLAPMIFDLDRHVIPPTPKDPEHYHYDVRFLIRADSLKLTLSEESSDLAWFPIANAREVSAEESMRRLYDKLEHMRVR
ncbi:MAG: NUDIX hydrolase [Deltaproteobacteria bacterium]|nr:NUDIX hydrolase [Deltaproteobacteria bacterium]MBI3295155.1 NUDIX hydrolase [Deltaproteobacteria bacterium]